MESKLEKALVDAKLAFKDKRLQLENLALALKWKTNNLS
jgi:hypothetical protein